MENHTCVRHPARSRPELLPLFGAAENEATPGKEDGEMTNPVTGDRFADLAFAAGAPFAPVDYPRVLAD